MKIPYLPNTDEERMAMLREINVPSIDVLFHDVPEQFLDVPFDLPPPLSELELKSEFQQTANTNVNTDVYACFLGGGYYHHFIPSVVSHITGRSEFYTAYTPYQAEASQGTLQIIYEYQSIMCQLTGMDVSNAGMYDGSTAATEAALMACRHTKKNKIAVLTSVNPRYISVMETYLCNHKYSIIKMGPDLEGLLSDYSCLVVQQPNFFGYFEDLQTYSEKAHEYGVLLVVIFDPISLGMFKSPGEYGADIAVAEGQPMGSPISFGGPGLGVFTCRKDYVRQIPGRLVGKTVDIEGKTGYVLTLATREQHIRRERATSNICTNEALVALAATVYLTALGKSGLRQVAELCYHKAHFTAKLIDELDGYSLVFSQPFFREFVVSCPRPPAEINEFLLKNGVIGGLDISHMIKNGMLFCVTEMNSRQEIEKLVTLLGRIGG
jgi:glycine dehydrogenase subunit 1